MIYVGSLFDFQTISKLKFSSGILGLGRKLLLGAAARVPVHLHLERCQAVCAPAGAAVARMGAPDARRREGAAQRQLVQPPLAATAVAVLI